MLPPLQNEKTMSGSAGRQSLLGRRFVTVANDPCPVLHLGDLVRPGLVADNQVLKGRHVPPVEVRVAFLDGLLQFCR